MNFGDIPFANLGNDNFFLQTREGNHIMVNWLFFKEHNHLTPVVFDLTNKSYKIVNATRLLWPNRIWQSDKKLYGEFKETVWIESSRSETVVTIEIGNDFKEIDSFYNLNPNDLTVSIYKWIGEKLTIEKK